MPSTVAVRSVSPGSPATSGTTCTSDVPATKVGDVLIAIDVNNTTNKPLTSVAGLGGTWQLVTSSPAGDITGVFSVWRCLNATPSASSRTVTGTGSSLGAGENRALIVFCLTGAAANAAFISAGETNASVGSGDQNSPSTFLNTGEIAIAVGYSDTEPNSLKSTTPSSGWTIGTAISLASGTRFAKYAYHVSTADSVSHYITNARASGGARALLVTVLGALDIAGSMVLDIRPDFDVEGTYIPPPVLGELDLHIKPRLLFGAPPAIDLGDVFVGEGVYHA